MSGRTITLLPAAAVVAMLLLRTPAVLALQSTAPPAPQSASLLTGRGTIVGRVMDSETGAGVADAVVTLFTGAGQRAEDVRTTTAGAFTFKNVPPGAWQIGAVTPAYEGTALRRVLLELTDGQSLSDVVVRLRKFAALGGAVRDEAGEPVAGASVALLRRGPRGEWETHARTLTNDIGEYRFASLTPREYVVLLHSVQVTASEPTLVAIREQASADPALLADLRASGFMSGNNWTTVRVQDIAQAPGRAAAAPVRRDGRSWVYRPAFYPGVDDIDQALPVPIRAGEQREGLDLRLVAQHAVRVSGVLDLGGTAPPPMLVQLMARRAEAYDAPLTIASTISDRTGHFDFHFVPSGDYVIHVLRTPRPPAPPAARPEAVASTGADSVQVREPGAARLNGRAALATGPLLSASHPVTVYDRDVDGLVVPLARGARIGGRVVFEGTAVPPAADQLASASVLVQDAAGRSIPYLPGRLDETGEFLTPELPPGQYVLRLSLPGPWKMKSATLVGRDVADAALVLGAEDAAGVVITMTDRPASIAGSVRDRSATAAVMANVVVFPADRGLWEGGGGQPRRTRTVRSGVSGSFVLTDLPAGEYFVTALAAELPVDWQLPARLAAIAPSASRVVIGEGQRVNVTVTLAAGPIGR